VEKGDREQTDSHGRVSRDAPADEFVPALPWDERTNNARDDA
jgi:hypothetical protein